MCKYCEPAAEPERRIEGAYGRNVGEVRPSNVMDGCLAQISLDTNPPILLMDNGDYMGLSACEITHCPWCGRQLS